jgi:hypothetical protein
MITEEYRRVLEHMHSGGDWGTKGYKYFGEICAFHNRLGCRSILDYGCGRQTLRAIAERTHPGMEVRGYDPGIPAYAARPAPADLVVSTDVFEHIEREHLQAVIADVFALARRGVFLHIATKIAKRCLPDGRNAHLIVEPAAWWLAQIQPAGWQLVDKSVGSKTLKLWFTK